MSFLHRSVLRAAIVGTFMSSALLLGTPMAGAADGTALPLRSYLGAKHAAIVDASKKASTATALHAKVTAESRSGVRRLRLGQNEEFQYISDSGRDFAGYNLGAGSWDSLVGTLASAVADEYVVQAAAANIPLDALDVVFTSIPKRQSETLAYPNNLSYVAYIDSPASEAQLQALKQAVHANSAVIHLVTQPQQVSHAELEYTATPATRDPSQPPGLREFISEEKRPAVLAKKAQAAARGKANEPSTLIARAHVEPRTGLRRVFLGKDGYHQQLHDSASSLLGYGLAPTVEEHVLGVTTTCLAHIFEVQAATRNVLLDSLEVIADADLSPRFGKDLAAPARYTNIRYKARVASPAPEEEIIALRDAVEATCPLYNLVKDAQTLEGKIVRAAYAAAQAG